MYIATDTPRFPIVDFYIDMCHLYNIYGVVAEDLHLLDVGKLDALGPAEEFVRNENM